MIGFSSDPKTDVLIHTYKTYKLYGRIKEKDVAKYKKSKDKKYILYRFCINEREEPIPDYRAILEEQKVSLKQQHLAERKARGYKTL